MTSRRLSGRQSGYVTLIMVLVLLVLGALVITPLLGFVIAGTRQGQQREERTQEFYAADAGVEDALWRIRNSALPEYLLDTWRQAYWDSPSAFTCRYSLDPVNRRTVDVSLRRLWLLEGLEDPHGGTQSLRGLVTTGMVIGEGQYQISLVNTLRGALRVQRIACFLPSDCQYVRGSSNLERDLSVPPLYRCQPTVVFNVDRNGWVISWDYTRLHLGGLDYASLPGDAVTRIITFRFDAEGPLRGAFAWVRTHLQENGLSFSSGVDLYQITSTGADPVTEQQTTVTARAIREGAGTPGAAIHGDYSATGNTLLRDHNRDGYYRERLYLNSPASIDDIPPGARVEKVLLYWSGWMNSPWDAWYEDRPFEEWSTANQQALLGQVREQELDRVQLQVDVGNPIRIFDRPITASLSQALPNGCWLPGMEGGQEEGWAYSCYADITDEIKDYFVSAGVPYDGRATYTVGHVQSSLGNSGSSLYPWKDLHVGEFPYPFRSVYPLGDNTDPLGGVNEWAYAGWSVVVIYTSPEVEQHRLYLYDTFRYCHNSQTLVFPITGFLAPPDVAGDPAAARFTCFVGEGDDVHQGDRVWLNHLQLPHPVDMVNLSNNVWNSRSSVLPFGSNDGIDIDTFAVGHGLGISPGDTEAVVKAGAISGDCLDSWNLIYIILSFRSDLTSVTLISYIIETGG